MDLTVIADNLYSYLSKKDQANIYSKLETVGYIIITAWIGFEKAVAVFVLLEIVSFWIYKYDAEEKLDKKIQKMDD